MMGEIQGDEVKSLSGVCAAFLPVSSQRSDIVTACFVELKLKIRITNLMRNVTLSVYDN